MPVREPGWWYSEASGWAAPTLGPIARVWGWAATRRIARATPYVSTLPVICVGNFTVGGTGKTPLSMLLAERLAAKGERPVFLTRGYGGRVRGPHVVKVPPDTSIDVGDEPLLLMRHAPVIVSRDRVAGARLAKQRVASGEATVVVMDDGLQNPGLAKDLSVAIVDGVRGLGNGRVIPAGPLRAPLDVQFTLADAIVVITPPGVEAARTRAVAEDMRRRFTGPVLEAWVEPVVGDLDLRGRKVVALAGIANPSRFYNLLELLGAEIVERVEFRDHHAFREADAARVLELARSRGAQILTTEKDRVRLLGSGGLLAELHARSVAVPIRMQFNERDELRLQALIEAVLAKRRKADVKL